MSRGRLKLVASPHLKAPVTTARIMGSVIASLVPVVAAATWFFGVSALLVIGAATAGAMATEALLGRPRDLADGSAAITGLLLGLTLPASMPLWMAFVGGVTGIGLGKAIFGGLGQNVFNPALLGRAFLQAAFPQAITTWPAAPAEPTSIYASTLAFPLMKGADTITTATPLGMMKFEGTPTDLFDLAIGTTAGSLGETSAVLIVAGGAYLALRRFLDWRIPVSIVATVAALSWALSSAEPSLPGPGFMLLSGGLLLGAVYMATDPVTSPVTDGGAWIFGVGVGVLVVIIRYWGGLPEGVMYAILLMNALVPFIDRVTRPRVFGTGRGAAGAA